jgi:hypothetical protein
MDKLDFQLNELDLIWCEGAIYNIGFEKGMNYWNKLKKAAILLLPRQHGLQKNGQKKYSIFGMKHIQK